MLATGQRGVYPMERVERLSPERLQRFFLRGAGAQAGYARIRPELQRLITFVRVNLLDVRWPVREGLDAIFCRNVMIYFDKPTQYQILKRFVPLLRPEGLLFAGHSESFLHAADLFKSIGRTVYERTDRNRDRTQGGEMSDSDFGSAEHLANNRYYDRQFDVEAVKVLPGEYFVTTSEMMLVTVLGSCVSACIRDRDKGLGGMNHFMLADARFRRPGGLGPLRHLRHGSADQPPAETGGAAHQPGGQGLRRRSRHGHTVQQPGRRQATRASSWIT